MRISFYTFGCTVNAYETQKLKASFLQRGDRIVEEGESDAVIINSCAITGAAEKQILRLIARLKRKNPRRIVAVVGCYGESLLQKGRQAAPDVDILLGNDKFGICQLVHQFASAQSRALPDDHGAFSVGGASQGGRKGNAFLPGEEDWDKERARFGTEDRETGEDSGRKAGRKVSEAHAAAVSDEKTPLSGFLQVQNGCDNYCSYCIVPHLRGPSVSKDPEEIREALGEMAEQGYREIVLAGLNLGLYRCGGMELMDLLQMAEETPGIQRIRLSSLEPMDLNSRFLAEFSGIKKLVSHLHISLQSGSDRILQRMNRRYCFQDYLSMITGIRRQLPGIAITTDLIVGFPGETEGDFRESMCNVIRCQFSDIHIFKYSQRKGTPAAVMPNQVTEHQKANRAMFLKGIKWQTKYNYTQSLLGKTVEAALFEAYGDGPLWRGYTSQNLPILVTSPEPPGEGSRQVRITETTVGEDLLRGELL